jgi:hypothetical protein
VSKLRLPLVTRIAIWRAHRKLCAYCGEPVAFNDLDVDHIIPESSADDTAKLQEVRREYGLPDDFHVDCLCNLIPAHHRPCNLSKSNRLFNPARARYFLEIASGKEAKVRRYEDAIVLESRKDSLLGSIAAAIEEGTLTMPDIAAATSDSRALPLSAELQFADGSAEHKVREEDLERLLDRPVLIGGTPSIDGIDFVNDSGSSLTVRTCREYRAACASGYYPGTNFAIKMDAFLSAVNAVLSAVTRAKIASVTFLNNPHVGVADLHLLPPNVLPMLGPKEQYPQKDLETRSLAELARAGRLHIVTVSSTRLQFEWGHSGAVLSELLRADLDDDGIEEILVQYYTYAVGGTLGFGSIGVLRRVGPSEMFIFEFTE